MAHTELWYLAYPTFVEQIIKLKTWGKTIVAQSVQRYFEDTSIFSQGISVFFIFISSTDWTGSPKTFWRVIYSSLLISKIGLHTNIVEILLKMLALNSSSFYA